MTEPSSKNKNTHPSLHRRLTVALTSDETAQQLQRKFTQKPKAVAVAGEHVMELEFTEEWDGRTPFYQHCIAGSMAGVAEHLLMYPFDTIKTYIQTTKKNNISSIHSSTHHRAVTAAATTTATTEAIRKPGRVLSAAAKTTTTTTASASASAIPHSSMSMWTILRSHVQSTSEFGRLWRGAQAMATGCIPAHALYFSSYEAIKSFFLTTKGQTTTTTTSAAGQQQKQKQKNTTDNNNNNNNSTNTLGPFGSAVAGSTAAFCHDLIMVRFVVWMI